MEEKFQCKVDFLLYSPNLSKNVIDNLENSNKVILNSSILNKLSKRLEKIESPMIFKITNITEFGIYEDFVGVHDFSASGNKIYLPNAIGDNLFVEKDSLINIEYYVPPKGTFIKIKPKTDKFYEVQEVKYILEKCIIDNYPVLSKDDIIRIKYFDSIIQLNVVECLPFDVISTNNTDLEVDFIPIDKPKYTEPVQNQSVNDLNSQLVNDINDEYEKGINFEKNKTTNNEGLKLGGNNTDGEKKALESDNPRIKAFMERRKILEKKKKKKENKLEYENTPFYGKGYSLRD